jgi:hypothetical protein
MIGNNMTPKDAPFCLNATGSDGKKVVVGRLTPSQAEHEAGRFYFGVFNSGTEITGERRVTLNRTYFTDPAAAVQVGMQWVESVSGMQVCRDVNSMIALIPKVLSEQVGKERELESGVIVVIHLIVLEQKA